MGVFFYRTAHLIKASLITPVIFFFIVEFLCGTFFGFSYSLVLFGMNSLVPYGGGVSNESTFFFPVSVLVSGD